MANHASEIDATYIVQHKAFVFGAILVGTSMEAARRITLTGTVSDHDTRWEFAVADVPRPEFALAGEILEKILEDLSHGRSSGLYQRNDVSSTEGRKPYWGWLMIEGWNRRDGEPDPEPVGVPLGPPAGRGELAADPVRDLGEAVAIIRALGRVSDQRALAAILHEVAVELKDSLDAHQDAPHLVTLLHRILASIQQAIGTDQVRKLLQLWIGNLKDQVGASR